MDLGFYLFVSIQAKAFSFSFNLSKQGSDRERDNVFGLMAIITEQAVCLLLDLLLVESPFFSGQIMCHTTHCLLQQTVH